MQDSVWSPFKAASYDQKIPDRGSPSADHDGTAAPRCWATLFRHVSDLLLLLIFLDKKISIHRHFGMTAFN